MRNSIEWYILSKLSQKFLPKANLECLGELRTVQCLFPQKMDRFLSLEFVEPVFRHDVQTVVRQSALLGEFKETSYRKDR